MITFRRAAALTAAYCRHQADRSARSSACSTTGKPFMAQIWATQLAIEIGQDNETASAPVGSATQSVAFSIP